MDVLSCNILSSSSLQQQQQPWGQGYPTLIYGDPTVAGTYQGELDYESLSEFTKINLSEPLCSAYRVENCSEDEKELIQEIMKRPVKELEDILDQVDEQVRQAEGEFDAMLQKFQEEYDIMVEEFNTKIYDIKERSNYRYIEQVRILHYEEEQQEQHQQQQQQHEAVKESSSSSTPKDEL